MKTTAKSYSVPFAAVEPAFRSGDTFCAHDRAAPSQSDRGSIWQALPMGLMCVQHAEDDHALAVHLPTTREALLEISGIGRVKLERYGEALLSLLGSAGI